MIKLYSYFRSSSSYRVRIALELKAIDHETLPVHLLNSGGEQFLPEFKKINQASKIPVLDHDGFIIAQSTAILEYLEETFSQNPLLPVDKKKRAINRQLCQIINSDIQPLQNLSVLNELTKTYELKEDEKLKWIQHWMNLGLHSYESLVKTTAGLFSMGDDPTMADCFLIPQVYNAVRFKVDLSPYPTIERICNESQKLVAFQKAHPDQQIDAPKK